jgi:8-oxo-dGTP diphosphatase
MYQYNYPRPALAADIVLFAKEKNDWFVLLIQRKNEPFKNLWALPGGFVEQDELIKKAALRELKEETGITGIALKFLDYFDDPVRDPRERVITMVFTGIAEKNIPVKAASDAKKAEWFNIKDMPGLAFDHKKIIELALTIIPR